MLITEALEVTMWLKFVQPWKKKVSEKRASGHPIEIKSFNSILLYMATAMSPKCLEHSESISFSQKIFMTLPKSFS